MSFDVLYSCRERRLQIDLVHGDQQKKVLTLGVISFDVLFYCRERRLKIDLVHNDVQVYNRNSRRRC